MDIFKRLLFGPTRALTAWHTGDATCLRGRGGRPCGFAHPRAGAETVQMIDIAFPDDAKWLYGMARL